jgi:hypothetical protein
MERMAIAMQDGGAGAGAQHGDAGREANLILSCRRTSIWDPRGDPHGNRHRTRHLLNQEFMQALLLHFRQHGKKAIEKVAREQPAAYLKILALLVPREHKVEHRNLLKEMTDEELEAAIEFIEKILATQAEKAKVIDGTTEATALPAPAEFEQPRRNRRNRLLEHVDMAVGPCRKPR